MQLWTPNQQLQNGKFTIQKVLGGGGYGVTYSAFDTGKNKTVAIKTLNPIHQSQANFEQQQIKFVQEAFRLVQCNHPHIVKVHEVINENGLWGMVMEYIQGQDLAVYISQNGKLSQDEALKYINQIGTALEYIHQQGMLHRDVKPNNIMLRQNKQEAVLIDFGLAREFDLNQTGSMTNSKTEGYAPIEQYERRGKFGAYTDVYALAATLYALVTGDIPLPANFRQTGIPLPAPKQGNPEIGDRLNDGIIKGMELEPENRPQTVKEWLDLVIPTQVQLPIGRLEKLLSDGEWRKADILTQSIIFGRGMGLADCSIGEKRNSYELMKEFPLEYLRIIDTLWLKYSNGRFGFSVQNKIWERVEANISDFAHSVGWINKQKQNDMISGYYNNALCYEDLVFDLSAPVGHLPCFCGNFYPSGDTQIVYYRGDSKIVSKTYIFLVDFGTNRAYNENLSDRTMFSREVRIELYRRKPNEYLMYLDEFFSRVESL